MSKMAGMLSIPVCSEHSKTMLRMMAPMSLGVEGECPLCKYVARIDDLYEAEIERRRNCIIGYDEQVKELMAERNNLLELVAVLNGDGGQHHGKVGTKQAVKDGLKRFCSTLKELDKANALLRGWLDTTAGKDVLNVSRGPGKLRDRTAAHLNPGDTDGE